MNGFFRTGPILYGWTDATWGNAKKEKVQKAVLEKLKISSHPLVLCQQTHGDQVAFVNPRTAIGLRNSTKNMGDFPSQKSSTIPFKYALTFLVWKIIHLFRLGSRNQSRSLGVKIPEPTLVPQVDGLVTMVPKIVLGIFTADCVPVFIYQSDPPVVAVIHVGWRGSAQNILKGAIEKMVKKGNVSLTALKVVMGPHIQQCCYQVRKEVQQHFLRDCILGDKLSLKKALMHQLEAVGVRQEQITLSSEPECTSCQSRFFSYRRDKTESRMLSLITIL